MGSQEARSSHWSWRGFISAGHMGNDADKIIDWPTAGA